MRAAVGGRACAWERRLGTDERYIALRLCTRERRLAANAKFGAQGASGPRASTGLKNEVEVAGVSRERPCRVHSQHRVTLSVVNPASGREDGCKL